VQFEQVRALFQQALPLATVQPIPTITILALKDEASLRALLHFAPAFALLAAHPVAEGQSLYHAYEFAQRAVSFEPRISMYELVLAKVLGRMDRMNRDGESP
jgi:hypothetical protein